MVAERARSHVAGYRAHTLACQLAEHVRCVCMARIPTGWPQQMVYLCSLFQSGVTVLPRVFCLSVFGHTTRPSSSSLCSSHLAAGTSAGWAAAGWLFCSGPLSGLSGYRVSSCCCLSTSCPGTLARRWRGRARCLRGSFPHRSSVLSPALTMGLPSTSTHTLTHAYMLTYTLIHTCTHVFPHSCRTPGTLCYVAHLSGVFPCLLWP